MDDCESRCQLSGGSPCVQLTLFWARQGFDSKKKGRPPITKDASRNARSAEGEPLHQEDPTTKPSSEKSGTKKRKAGPGGQSKRVTQKARRPVTSSS